ncbi:CBS domain-containing protein [Candidatus Woesearchaeota archaeon]|nr:CBS domain-containing protein [Candidatus Woesearchaeota archaeon]
MNAKDILFKDYIAIDANDRMTTLIGKLKVHGAHHAVVFDGKKYIGMTNKRRWVRTRINSSEVKVRSVLVKVPTLSKETSLSEIARLMYTADTPVLPVLEKGRVIGTVCAHDVIASAQDALRKYRLDEVSTERLTTVNWDDTIARVVNIIKNKGYDHLPVLENGKLVGIVTAVDLLETYLCFPPDRQGSTGRRGAAASPTKEAHTAHITIDNEMSRLVQTITPGARLDAVADLMDKHHLSSLVVVDEKNKPVGIVTVKNLLKVIAKNA